MDGWDGIVGDVPSIIVNVDGKYKCLHARSNIVKQTQISNFDQPLRIITVHMH
jgi:hypothetical protein